MPITKTEKSFYYTPKYEKLASDPIKGRKVAKECLRYAGYMVGNILNGDHSKGFEEVSWKGHLIKGNILFTPAIKNIIEKLKGLGFSEDGKGNFYDPKTGTIFHMIYDISDKKNREIVLCFKGLGNESLLNVDHKTQKKVGIANTNAAIREFMGGLPKASLQAMKIGKILKEEGEKSDLKPVVVGHSHGGGIAQTAAAAGGIKGVVFNSRPMGGKVRQKIGKETLQKNRGDITAFAGKKDWLSRTTPINKIAFFAKTTLKIPRLPRTIGKGYDLPKVRNRPKEINRLLFHHISFYDQLHELLKKR